MTKELGRSGAHEADRRQQALRRCRASLAKAVVEGGRAVAERSIGNGHRKWGPKDPKHPQNDDENRIIGNLIYGNYPDRPMDEFD